MFGKTLALVAAAATLASAGDCPAYPPPFSAQSPGNSVTTPSTLVAATIGTAGDIIWDATSWGSTVTIYLLRGPSENIQLYSTLATDAPNTGAFSWTPDCALTPDTTHWGLMIESNDLCTFQWSMQFGLNPPAAGTCSSTPSSSASAPPASSSAAPPPVSSSAAPPPVSSGKVPPPPVSSGSPPPKGSGAPYPAGNNCTSTSTVWVNPTGTGSYTPPKASYTAYSNDGARFGMSMFGAAAAVAVALLL